MYSGTSNNAIDITGTTQIGLTGRFTAGGFLSFVITDASHPDGYSWRFQDNTALVNGGLFFRVKYTSGDTYIKGNLGIGTVSPGYTLDVTGTIRASLDIIAYSDIRVKKDIEKIDNALEKISQISGYTFNRKDGDSKRQAGVIAQEVKKVLPEVVHEDENGMYSVAYGNLIALLVEAIKEEKCARESLEMRIKLLEEKYDRINSQ
jgi:hypothetical protein